MDPVQMSQTTDITNKFTAAASVLQTGQLIKDESFTLFEAVGALEIMDPKMDSGYLEPGDSLETDYDVLRELLPEEVVGIMDQLLCSEIAWHMGHSLSQTLFTSVYVDKILSPEPNGLGQASFGSPFEGAGSRPLLHLVLRSYCLALIKTCDFVHGIITGEQYFEEEDFSAHLYNRSLLSHLPVEEIEGLLDDALEFVKNRDASASEEAFKALEDRLRFRKAFLRAVRLSKTDDTLYSRKTKWEKCLELLHPLQSSQHIGKPVGDSFSAKIQRRLASSTPPRPIVQVEFQAAYDCLTRICSDVRHALSVLDCTRGSNIITFFLVFHFRKPQPCIYVRCLLQSLVFSDTKVLERMSVKQLIYGDLAELVLPSSVLLDDKNDEVEAPHDSRFKMAEIMNKFASATSNIYLDLIRALSMNRCRMRRLLCHTIIDWENMQLDAEDMDTEIHTYTDETPRINRVGLGEEMWSFSLSSWTYYQKLRQMEWIVQMGFELQIYQADELSGMYWYLRYLAEVREKHLRRIYSFVRTEQNMSHVHRPHKERTAAISHALLVLSFTMVEAEATRSFASSLSYLYKALTVLSMLPVPPRPYSNSEFRHSLRMRPFIALSPPSVPSQDELENGPNEEISEYLGLDGTNEDIRHNAHVLLLAAEDGCRAARREWDDVSKWPPRAAQCVGCEIEWKERIKDILRSVIATSIAITTLKKIVTANFESGLKSISVEVPESGYHAWWTVPKITVRPTEQ